MRLTVIIKKTETGFRATCSENKMFGYGTTVSGALEVLQTNLERAEIVN